MLRLPAFSTRQRHRSSREMQWHTLYCPAQLLIAVLVACLAIYAVPFPGSLILLGAAVLGAVWALIRLRRREGEP